MYSVYDKASAVLQVQGFLNSIGTKDIFVATSGIYDENTRLSVISFQKENGLVPSGVVDLITFRLLYDKYVRAENNKKIRRENSHITSFPINPGKRSRGMAHINRLLTLILNYYGHNHNINENSNFYTYETENAVGIVRKIYNLATDEYIDEELYQRMLIDSRDIENRNYSNAMSKKDNNGNN